jgi:hypothetical protein
MSTEEQSSNTETAQAADARAIAHLKKSIADGKHWYLALLESIYIWRSTKEDFRSRHYNYLIDDEAFDWLLLAERLLSEVDEGVPEEEKINLLFYDQPPQDLPNDVFKKLIGDSKYKAYLNFIYGVLVEEALVSAVTEEVRKERRLVGLHKENEAEVAYERIYGEHFESLFEQFLQDKKYRRRTVISQDMAKELNYWLFKYRLKHADKSRAASDTKKALIYLQHHTMAKKKRSG